MPGRTEKILDYLREMGREPSEISRIAVTHCHMDHIGNLKKMKELTGAEILIHKDEAGFLSGEERMEQPNLFFRLLFKALGAFFPAPEPIKPDLLLSEGDAVGSFSVIHIPGHTPGSIALYDRKERVMIVGDTLISKNGRVSGPVSKPFTLDMEAARRSGERISSFDFDLLLSGHGIPIRPDASEKVRRFVEKG